MKVMKTILKAVVGLAILAAFSLWAVGIFKTKTPPGKVAVQRGFSLPAGAPLFQAKAEPVSPRVGVVGTTASEEKINLSARIPAYVDAVHASAGRRVKKGDLLVSLDDREVQKQIAAATAELTRAEKEFQRSKKLFEQEAATEQDLTSTTLAFELAQAELERVKVMLTYAKIVSPIDGMVADRRIEAGDLANAGQVLMTVYNPASMRLEAPVPVRLVERVKLGQAVSVRLDRPDRCFEGTVSEVVSEIDPQSRTQLVKVLLEDPNGEVLPGTFGRLQVEEEARDKILVPGEAVYRVGQLELVQLVREGRVIRRAVKTGALYEDRVEILSGLEDGDTILAKPVPAGA